MKAEHRRELKGNELAEQLTRLAKGFRSGPKSSSAIIWVIAVLAVVTFGVWLFSGYFVSDHSAVWVQLENDYDPDHLKRIAEESKGTFQARTALFQRARILLRQGLENIYSYQSDLRIQAAVDLEEARKLFQALLPECKDEAVLTQEALMGAAKAEEALVAFAKEDNPDETRGNLDRALELYQRLADAYADSFFGRQAKQHLADLSDPSKRKHVENFYADLRKLTETKKR